MIIIDRLKLSDDGKYMYINAHVNNASYFRSVYIDTITIMTADKVSELSPELPTTDYIYKNTITGNNKEISLVLSASDFIGITEKVMKETLFFVYISAKGTPAIDTPCGLDVQTVVGVTFNEKMLYQKTMEFTKELANSCSVSKEFTDFILLWNAFKASVETGHYVSSIKFYNMLFNSIDSSIYISKTSCGCYG